MKKLTIILLALGLAWVSCAQNGNQSKNNEIDKFLNRYVNLNKFNGTVLVAKGGDVLLHKGYGFADYEKRKLNDTNSIFQIYSITKTFTSTMILKLADQNLLALSDPLTKYFPTFPKGENITIQHLLTHTSGINDDAGDKNAPQTEEYRVAQFGKNKVHFAPGEGWSYCNGGYQLLGYIIKQITKKPYELAIRENIFNPLGMSNSGFDFKNLASPGKVNAYHIFTNDVKQSAELYDSIGPYAAGSIYCTASDLYKYYNSFKTHQLLNQESLSLAFTPSKTNGGYGHGWQIKTGLFKNRVIGHSGGAAGFRSNFSMILEDDICVILLNNHENANTEFLTQRILEILYDKVFETVEEVDLNVDHLEKLVGAYKLTEPRPMLLYTSILDDRLAIDVDGQGKSTLIAKNETSFIQEEASAVLEFQRNENGIYSKIKITQGNFSMVAERIESSWGLLGSATAKGWDDVIPDIKFTEDRAQKGLWVLKNVPLTKGEIKFRLNNDWNINYGSNEGMPRLNMHGDNIQILEAGIYDMRLDLTDESNLKFSIIKKPD
ncbi:MAG TPA: serine hydrolase [Saprospiraceae bacterium]|nr:serine hydrolase [Saprospiraceae bacterium]